MSWKRILATALLFLIVASPALAQPTLQVVDGDYNETGHVFNVLVTPDPLNTPWAFELGFRAIGGNILSVVPNPPVPSNGTGTPTTPIEFLTPGNVIFGWETLNPDANNKPVGIQIGPSATGHDDEAFVAVGSNILNETTHILTITTRSSVDVLKWGGIYNADGTLGTPNSDLTLTGRIAQLTMSGGTVAQNYYGFSSALGELFGDYDNSFHVAQGDLDLVLLNWGKIVPPEPVPPGWINQQPSGLIGASYLDTVLFRWGDGGSSGAAFGGVPEPAGIAFICLASVALARQRPARCLTITKRCGNVPTSSLRMILDR